MLFYANTQKSFTTFKNKNAVIMQIDETCGKINGTKLLYYTYNYQAYLFDSSSFLHKVFRYRKSENDPILLN